MQGELPPRKNRKQPTGHFFMTFRWNIRHRLQVSATIVAGVILGFVVGWGYVSGKEEIYRETQSRAMFLAEGAAAIFDGRMLRQQGTMRGIASALDSDGVGITLEQAKKLESQVLWEDKEIFGVCVALAPGFSPQEEWADRAPYTFRMPDGTLGYRNLEYENGKPSAYWEEAWFQLAAERKKPVWCPPYEWEGILMVTFSCPLWTGEGESKRFAGVTTCDLTLEWIDEQLATLPDGPDDYALLMDKKGLYIAHPQKELVLRKTMFQVAEEKASATIQAFAQRMVSGESGVEEHISFVTDQKSWVAYVPLHSAEWIFAAVLSQDAMRDRLTDLALQQAGIGIGGLLLLLGALAWVARTITVPVETLHRAARTLADGNLHAELPAPRGGDEIADLTRSFSFMRDHLIQQMDELAKTTAVRERMESELRIAHDIQMGLVPKELPAVASAWALDLCPVLEPAREVGGDFYDFFPIGENELAFLVGDVSGKGVPAALHMAATRSLLRSFFKSESDPGKVLARINKELAPDNPSCMFVTLFCATLRLSDGLLRYSSAGHNPPLLVQPDGSTSFLKTPGAPPVGVLLSVDFPTEETVLPAGVVLLLYTDGVTEASTRTHDLYGEERLENAATAAGKNATCQQVVTSVLSGIRFFVDGAPASDDITLLAIQRTEVPEPEKTWEREIGKNEQESKDAINALDSWMEEKNSCSELRYSVRLAFEELATNAIKYTAPPAGGARMKAAFCGGSQPQLIFENDGPFFDPWKDATEPDIEAPPSAREPGGLGIHLVRAIAAKVSYERKGNTNICLVEFFPPANHSFGSQE